MLLIETKNAKITCDFHNMIKNSGVEITTVDSGASKES